MDALRQSLRYAARGLTRSPGFSLVAVLTLALGIGATLAIFTVLNAVVLEPLRYPGPERLVRIENRVPGVGPEDRWNLSPAGYLYFKEESRTLEELGVYLTAQTSLTGDGPAERIQVARVSAGVLEALRARPALGRLLVAEDDQPRSGGAGNVLPGPAQPVAVLGHDLWVRRYGADPAVVGATIEVGGNAVPVVGVMERGMDLPNPGLDVDVWMPLGLDPAANPTNWHSFQAVGRLRDGVSIESAQAEFQEFTSRFTELFPSAYDDAFMRETGFSPVVTPLGDWVVGDIGRTLWVLLGAVGLVLLIACANVANLFLVRTEGRQREIAIRAAVGATRGRLARQFLVEGLLLAFLGGLLGLLLADAGVSLLVATAPEGLPRLDEVGIGWTVVGFAALVATLVGLAVGSFPLLRFGANASAGALREAGRASTTGRARSFLIVGQVAMALVLLASAGLLFQSFQRLRSVDPGLDARGVLAMDLDLPSARYRSHEDVATFYEALTAQVEALPGVQGASVASSLPLANGTGCASIYTEDQPLREDDQPPCVPMNFAAPGFFETLGISVRGRTPTWADVNRRSGGAVVSRALAERLWPGEDPIGKGIRGNGWARPFYRVVGVTEDVRYEGLDQPPTEIAYYPLLPMEGAGLWGPQRSATLVVRAETDRPMSLTGPVRRVLAQLDPDIPIANVRTMEEVVAGSMARASFAMLLLGIAAAVALALGAVGLYGVLAYVVGQRRKEIGIRIALGARVEQVAGMVVRHSLRLALAGVTFGLVAALAATRVLQSLLYDVSPSDPLVLGLTSLVLIAVALLASYLPARRATRVDPMTALRTE